MLQFLLRNKRLFFLLLIFLISFTLFTGDLKKRRSYTVFDRLMLGLLATPLKMTSLSYRQLYQLWDNYFYLVDLKK